MTFVEAELASQPDCWQTAAELVAAGGVDLPAAGDRVAAVGCGTSQYMAQAYARRRESAGEGETDAFAASEFPIGRAYDRVVALSRSGTTTEVVDLLARLDPARTVALTGVAGTPAEERAGATIVLDFAAERSVVQTRFATTALAVLRASLGEDLGAVIAEGRRALADPLPPAQQHLVFLGRGWSEGLAHEAALKCRESAGAWTEAYTAMEYRHGPISAAGDGTLVWALDRLPLGLAGEIEATGATVVESAGDPLAALVRAQRYGVGLAKRAGLDPDRPRHLQFSVVLDA